MEDYLALAFCTFHSLCWLLSDLEDLVSLRGSDLRKHSFAPPHSPQDYHGKMEGSATSDKALFDWEKSSLFGSEGF